MLFYLLYFPCGSKVYCSLLSDQVRGRLQSVFPAIVALYSLYSILVLLIFPYHFLLNCMLLYSKKYFPWHKIFYASSVKQCVKYWQHTQLTDVLQRLNTHYTRLYGCWPWQLGWKHFAKISLADMWLWLMSCFRFVRKGTNKDPFCTKRDWLTP